MRSFTKIPSGLKNLRLVAMASTVAALTAATAHAGSFTNTTTGAIGNNTACAGAPNFGATINTGNLVRTFNVTGEPNVIDLDVGFIASHTWRGDIRFILRPPSGAANEVTLIVSDTTANGNDDNYNIRLSDQASTIVNTGTHDVGNNTATAPYQFTVHPSNAGALDSFNGTNPNGTWSMIFCDNAGTEEGQFLRGELIFGTANADLSLSLASSNNSPEISSSVNITATLANAGVLAASATVNVPLPTGLSYVSHSGGGSYDPSTGIWTAPAGLANGASSQLVINALVQTTGSYAVSAEIATSSVNDPDSTPGNNSTTEDDDDSLVLAPVPSTTPPSLTCPVGDQFSLNWAAPGATSGWTAGTTTNTYTAGGETISFAMTGDTNRFIPRTFGGSSFATPVTTTQFANGANAGEHGVVMNVDYTTTSENVLTTINLGTPGTGVGELQFQILDVDNGAWVDRIVITGSLDGSPVTPILTSSGSNTVSGTDTFLGTSGAPTGDAAGNTTVTFMNPVDVVTFSYDNASATTDPASQVISLQKLEMCPFLQADITAVKTVEVYDPGNVGLYMTPGNEVLYKITVTNSADANAPAEDVNISDTLPENLKFVSASTTGFTGGAFGTPDLPAPNTDCGATPCVVRFSGGDVAVDTTAEILVRAIIK